jgi:PST family polysaccharide transporter
VSPVAFPSYVSVREDPARFRRAYLRLLRTVTTVSLPAQIGLLVVASRLVETLYPPAWHGMAAPLQIFVAFGLVNSIVGTTGDVFKAANRPGWIPAIGAIHLPTLAVSLWLLVDRGPAGAAAALTFAALVSGSVALPLALRIVGISAGDFLRALGPQACATAVMAAAVFGAGIALPPAPSLLALAIACGTGVVVYAVALALLDPSWVRELRATAAETLTRRRDAGAASGAAVR